MASKRCGCASDSCACVLSPGDGIAVDGSGTATDPYTISAIPFGVNLAVQDENVVVRSGVSLLDFVGAGVTATPGDAGEVVVTIPGPGVLMQGVAVGRFIYTPGTYTWTKPANCLWVAVHVLAGGGGGGGVTATAASQAAAAGCGGGGAYATKVFNASELAATEPIIVGDGGAGAIAGNNAGTVGQSSLFGQSTYLITCVGGAGGAGMSATGTTAAAAGGDGGTATGGSLNVPGGDGWNGRVINTSPPTPFSGVGGASFMGNAQRPLPATTNAAGQAGQSFGNGGTGGFAFASQAGGFAGGQGGPGVVVVHHFVRT